MSSVRIEKNFTRYDTESLTKLLSSIVWHNGGRPHQYTVFTVRGCSVEEMYRQFGSRVVACTVQCSYTTRAERTLWILNPGGMVEQLSPMAQLAHSLDGSKLPAEAMDRIGGELRVYCRNGGDVVVDVVSDLNVQIHARRHDRVVPLTDAQWAAKHRARYEADHRGERHRNLASGGERRLILGGDSRSSGRAAYWLWMERIDEAARYYQREREYRQDIAEKVKARGGTLDAEYEKFSEFLFHMAKYFAERGE
jgi:hypothetical protein